MSRQGNSTSLEQEKAKYVLHTEIMRFPLGKKKSLDGTENKAASQVHD